MISDRLDEGRLQLVDRAKQLIRPPLRPTAQQEGGSAGHHRKGSVLKCVAEQGGEPRFEVGVGFLTRENGEIRAGMRTPEAGGTFEIRINQAIALIQSINAEALEEPAKSAFR